MREWFKDNSDKLMMLAILGAFAFPAVFGGADHAGSQYAQHVTDWALGGLGVLIVQRVAQSLKPPNG
jgi:hypothetical protein